jgi:hypothetical protein
VGCLDYVLVLTDIIEGCAEDVGALGIGKGHGEAQERVGLSAHGGCKNISVPRTRDLRQGSSVNG